MKRAQFYLDGELDARLRAAASAEGRSAAAVVRDAVERYLTGDQKDGEQDPFMKVAGKFEGKYRDAAVEHDQYLYVEDED